MVPASTEQGAKWNVMQRIHNRQLLKITNVSEYPALAIELLQPRPDEHYGVDPNFEHTNVLKMGEVIETTLYYSEQKRFTGGAVHEYIASMPFPFPVLIISYKNLGGQRFFSVYRHAANEDERNTYYRTLKSALRYAQKDFG